MSSEEESGSQNSPLTQIGSVGDATHHGFFWEESEIFEDEDHISHRDSQDQTTFWIGATTLDMSRVLVNSTSSYDSLISAGDDLRYREHSLYTPRHVAFHRAYRP